MNLEEEQDKIIKFIKAGLIIMSAVLLLAIGQRVLPEVVTVSASAKKLPIYCVDTEEKKVALSFDAAWGNEDTADILSILAKHNAKVTFFMTGG